MPRTYRRPDLSSPTVTVISGAEGDAQFTTHDAGQQETLRDMEETAAAVDSFSSTMAEADAMRDLPRARTDELHEGRGRKLSEPATPVARPTAHLTKALRRTTRDALSSMPRTEQRALASASSNHPDSVAFMVDLNEGLAQGPDHLEEAPPRIRQRITRIDRSIGRFERRNDRTHRVYAPISGGGDDPQALIDSINEHRTNTGQDPTYAFLGYTKATHDINDIEGDENQVYMEFETARGAFTGSYSGAKTHVLPRGVRYQYVSGGQQRFITPDGQEVSRWVLRVREIPREERTAARN